MIWDSERGSYMTDTITLLFVYNIDSGILQSIHDYSTMKGAGSGSDSCPLGAITHSPVGMKKEWKRFLKELPHPSRSLDRNEFTREFGQRPISFPIVLLKKGTELSILISTEELKACREPGDLIHLVKGRILDL
jgi:hypothetical protein